ncbi:hypothetical protein [Achromobacter anxifer]|jgi:hypothetical protein|uniref:Uncharacterized protein n=1 Tax=Achromobacter anxifer TaxID=1287737 RepID=A0A6S7DJ35_9BURK|nr:hypothetical protein [Achromobacter anxifer]MDF8363610.1 hypothetical protein [Achromobacter anxifer]CAB3882030.1 hypothetical protein LMG26858_03278 [Achromobacter anxifer]CAB5513911.1 hypothetical protein LMG26857_03191 [Achromobacter anxifer]
MENAKWDFQLERPVEDQGSWSIGYVLVSLVAGVPDERVAVEERFASAQVAIDEATRLAQIQVADLNGDTASFEKPTDEEVPFGKNPRF